MFGPPLCHLDQWLIFHWPKKNFGPAKSWPSFQALPFVIFWLPLFYILITPLLSSDYPFFTFWLPLFYILITPLLSSDYPFVIFWLPLWYLLITPLLSSDYTFGIFWLPLCYLLITPLVSSDHCIVSHSLIISSNFPFWYLLTIVLSVILWLCLLISPLVSYDHDQP